MLSQMSNMFNENYFKRAVDLLCSGKPADGCKDFPFSYYYNLLCTSTVRGRSLAVTESLLAIWTRNLTQCLPAFDRCAPTLPECHPHPCPLKDVPDSLHPGLVEWRCLGLTR